MRLAPTSACEAGSGPSAARIPVGERWHRRRRNGYNETVTDRILLIEDDARLAEMVRDYLSQAGFRVTRAENGGAGLAMHARESFDAIVLDLMLPDMDGLDVCRRVRARAATPILMLTARGDAMDRVVGLEMGADDYLPKPFEPRELLARLKAVLRRGRTGRSDDVLRMPAGEPRQTLTSGLGGWRRRLVDLLPGVSELNRLFAACQRRPEPGFADRALAVLGVEVDADPASIPETGAVIIVANHPTGALDGLALLALVRRRRADVKLLANGWLTSVAPLAADLVWVWTAPALALVLTVLARRRRH